VPEAVQLVVDHDCWTPNCAIIVCKLLGDLQKALTGGGECTVAKVGVVHAQSQSTSRTVGGNTVDLLCKAGSVVDSSGDVVQLRGAQDQSVADDLGLAVKRPVAGGVLGDVLHDEAKIQMDDLGAKLVHDFGEDGHDRAKVGALGLTVDADLDRLGVARTSKGLGLLHARRCKLERQAVGGDNLAVNSDRQRHASRGAGNDNTTELRAGNDGGAHRGDFTKLARGVLANNEAETHHNDVAHLSDSATGRVGKAQLPVSAGCRTRGGQRRKRAVELVVREVEGSNGAVREPVGKEAGKGILLSVKDVQVAHGDCISVRDGTRHLVLVDIKHHDRAVASQTRDGTGEYVAEEVDLSDASGGHELGEGRSAGKSITAQIKTTKRLGREGRNGTSKKVATKTKSLKLSKTHKAVRNVASDLIVDETKNLKAAARAEGIKSSSEHVEVQVSKLHTSHSAEVKKTSELILLERDGIHLGQLEEAERKVSLELVEAKVDRDHAGQVADFIWNGASKVVV